MNWRGIFLENWPYKLAALVLAVLLWFNVAAEKRQEHPVPTRLDLDVRDTAWVVASAPDRVQTTFQGRAGDILSLPMNPPVIHRVINTVTGPTMSLDLSPGMVSYEHDLKVSPVAVHPSSVEIRFERRVSRRVPVAPRLDLSAASGFAVVRPIQLKPESVTVRGAASIVSTIDSLPTESVSMKDLSRSVTRELRIERPPGTSGLHVEPGTILATVGVDSLVEASFTVPLELRGAAAGKGRPERDSVEVAVRGARPTVRSLKVSGVKAFVVVDSVPAKGLSLPVHVQVPDSTRVTATPAPTDVTVRPRGGGS